MKRTQPPRKQFKTAQYWYNFLQSKHGTTISSAELFELRKACYADIELLRGRPLLIYATKFLESLPPGVPNQIDLSDVDGFTDLIDSVDDNCQSVDVLLELVASWLKNYMFSDVRNNGRKIKKVA